MTLHFGRKTAWFEFEATCPACDQPFTGSVNYDSDYGDTWTDLDDLEEHIKVCRQFMDLLIAKEKENENAAGIPGSS